MNKLKRLALVLTLVILISLGLNTSNQAINSLTMDTRKPVIGCVLEDGSVSIFALGEEYKYNQDNLPPALIKAKQIIVRYFTATKAYLQRIWRIFYVVFLT